MRDCFHAMPKQTVATSLRSRSEINAIKREEKSKEPEPNRYERRENGGKDLSVFLCTAQFACTLFSGESESRKQTPHEYKRLGGQGTSRALSLAKPLG